LKRFACIALCLLTVFVSSGCKKEEPPEPLIGWPVSVAGTTLEVPPKAAVSLSPALTETIFSLGYGGRLVGVSDDCDAPSAAASRERCGSALYPDIEAILTLAPQIVFTPTSLPERASEAFAKAGIAVIVVSYSEDLEGIFRNYGTISRVFEGEVTGALREEQMRLYGQVMIKSALDSVLQGQPNAEKKTSIVWLRYLPLTMATGDTMLGKWLLEMGFENQAQPYTSWSYPVENEPDLNPDIILYDAIVSPEKIAAHEYYSRTNAVKNERLFLADCNPYDRQSPYMFYHLWDSMSAIFPDGFGEMPTDITVEMPFVEPPPEPTRWERITQYVERLLW
jgi:iron complex transport system substrate-binding protein